jgi:small subunit ribosomal protein S3Ae
MPEEKTAKTKIKKKKWIQVLSPEMLRNELIGEIPVYEPKSLIDRLITVNLMSLTRDMKKQNTSIKFIISNIKGDKAITEFYGYYLNPTSIKRLVRRGKEKIGLSIICKTSDNKKIRIMPLIIPFTKVKSSVATSFRSTTINYITSYAAKTTIENMIKDLVTNKLQRELKGVLKKVYPVRILEIAKLHIEREEKPVEKEIKVEVKEEEKPGEKKEEKVEEKPKEEKVEPKEEKKPEEKPKEEKTEPKLSKNEKGVGKTEFSQKEEKKVEEKKEEVKEEKKEAEDLPKK